ncbi:MAG: GntR family transcriptional regulator [Clostridiaceae bacterium]|jgi:GntR family transcriptional regulator|nr:GntR family transcriptional regulator [Clostridiaceae bacterium]
MLNGQAAIPLYQQLMNQIEEKITNGTYAPGERLQTESEMAKTYEVSIITVRKAISELIEKGLVDRKQGKGTFVTKPKFTKNVTKLLSFTEMCRRINVKPGGKMLENKLIKPSEKILKQLELPAGSQVIYISRLRYADGEPMVIENNYFPMEYIQLLSHSFGDNSLFEFLNEAYNVSVEASEKRIEICRALNNEAKLLNVRKNDPLLRIQSIAYSKNNKPIYSGVQIINGERFYLYV